ncbi:MAG TPA: Pr6Pr family membrane protein [Devosia sp.]|nr:Pr6Pr family membrane protein [Devosia sp.]
MSRIATIVGLLIGAAALLLQFGLTIPLRLTNGDMIFGALIYFFTFFTILSNLALVLIYVSELWPQSSLSWFRRPVTRGMMAAAIVLVALFYHFILAGIWDPGGLWKVADVTMHYVTPVFYVAWWILFARHGMLKVADVPSMLVPPTVYLVYAMIRGALVGEYPYPILEANRIGYGAVAINVFLVLVGLTLLCLIVVAADRMLTRAPLPGP